MKEIHQQYLSGERALFGEHDAGIFDTVFDDGESPLKESRNIELYGCLFRWKYPLWYSRNIKIDRCALFENARAGIWYTNDLVMRDTMIDAPKNFRRCGNIKLENVSFSNAAETLWSCRDVTMNNITARGDYFAMNSENLTIDGFTLYGNYSFDGVKNAEIRNAKLLTKDAFWNSENITVYDSFISGEYLGWNAKKLTLINCTVESLQGMCYIDDLVMKNCKLINTTLAFEYSSVTADITGDIDSVMNPKSGIITADRIGTLIIQKDRIDPEKVTIVCRNDGDNS